MAKYNKLSPSDAIRSLADYTEKIRTEMLHFAVSYNINIISGSMPDYTDEVLYNVSYLLRRDGTWEEQYKIHVTPDEENYWGVHGECKIRRSEYCWLCVLNVHIFNVW